MTFWKYLGGCFLTVILFANGVDAADTNDVWQVRPGEAYRPSTYCQWNRTGLPAAQQKICIDLDKKNAPKMYQAKPGEVLTTLIPSCQVGGAISCNDDLYQKVWQKIEADNGEATKIDMNSIEHYTNGTIGVVVYTYVPNTMFDLTRLKRLDFDCHGHFMESDGGSLLLDAPPRSVAGEIAAIICARPAPTSADYCAGFSSEACDRIKNGVEARIRPAYCKPGFAIVDPANKSLTPEQLRICYARSD